MRSMEAERVVATATRRDRQRRHRRVAHRRARRVRRSLLVLGLVVALVAGAALAARSFGGSEHPVTGALLLNENFAGDRLDADRWSPCYFWTTDGCTNLANKELEWYVPEQVSVGGGHLQLEARPQQVTGVGRRTFDYVSGMISGRSPARTMFSFKYGYVETRAKVPAGRGLWPAFWMLPTTDSSLPEVDIFEIVGEKPDAVQMHTHWEQDGQHRQRGQTWRGPDFSAGWHTFGLDWKPDSLTWYVDGVVRWRVTDPAAIPHESMYLLANLAVGGAYTTRPDAHTRFPATLDLDYIRVWSER